MKIQYTRTFLESPKKDDDDDEDEDSDDEVDRDDGGFEDTDDSY